ncbi:Ltp family lipoprotein [uncultured Ruminococcus sp.]|uniref:Ltp family lipoprotein n=1 Tax=uncultured Ruminococcus sp. TaxID=165186 RepID=UPI0025ECB623|nr:Ltp family lipoprotein [uncultured Ruminococcus sp.]
MTLTNDNEISVPDENYSFYYSDYQDVQKKLSSAGFTNIKTEPLYDIFWGITPEGSVEDVEINGKTNYKKGDKFNKDVEIVITYHLKIEDDPAYNSSSSSENTNRLSDFEVDSSLTQGQKNALRSAKNYISIMDFSRDGLIDQLQYEGYSYDDATYAADNCSANWSAEALESAKNYIKHDSFSYNGLIEQLEYEQYTYDQAVY